MNRNEIEAFVSRWLRAVQSGNRSEFEHLVASTVSCGKPGTITPRAAFQERAGSLERAFSELEAELDELLIDGDRIAWRWTMTGLHRAPFLGEAATFKRIVLRGTNFQRLANGIVVEHYTLVDALGALHQMRAA